MRSLLLTAMVFMLGTLSAQNETAHFGDVSMLDFNRNEFPDAPSVVLFDKAKFTYEWRGEVNYPIIERHIRVKINTREAFDTWGDYSLGSSIVEFSKVKAATYYLEGGKVVSNKIERDDIMKDRKSSNEKIFSLKNLRDGCIVELSFTQTYYRHVSPNWVIQHKFPVLWSEYALGGTKTLNSMIVGGLQPAIQDNSYKGGTYARWVFKNVPAFQEEDWMPSPRNYYGRLEFFLQADDWTTVSTQFQDWHFRLHEKFQKRIIKKTAEEITAGMTEPAEKIKAISTYIKKNFVWDSVQTYWCYDLNEVVEKKRGSSGDLNILLHTMLQEVGFTPNLVLLSTQSHGGVFKNIPSAWHFNYTISKLQIGDKIYLLDATDPLLPFDVLPLDCVNTEGFEMVGRTFNWISIPAEQKDKVNVNARLQITPDFALKGRVTVMSHGYAARDKRKACKDAGDSEFIKAHADPKWMLDSGKIANQGAFDQPFQETYYATIPQHITRTPERLYLDPYILLTERENIWKEEKRIYPIDFKIALERLLVVTLTLPEGYKIETLPANQTFMMNDQSVSCTFKTTQSNNILVVTYQFNVRKIWLPTEQYPDLRDFYSRIIARQNQPIILMRNQL